MKTIDSKEINVSRINVATYNSDPFAVETEDQFAEIADALENSSSIDVLTAEDADFSDWAAKLGYTDEMPEEIYVADVNYLAFTIE